MQKRENQLESAINQVNSRIEELERREEILKEKLDLVNEMQHHQDYKPLPEIPQLQSTNEHAWWSYVWHQLRNRDFHESATPDILDSNQKIQAVEITTLRQVSLQEICANVVRRESLIH